MVVMIPVAAVVCLAVGVPYLSLGYQHYAAFGGVNVAAQLVLLFLCINVVICLWELCLCYKHALIRSTHAKRVKDGQTKSVTIVVFRWMRFSEILSPSFWANIWIDYARFDDAYVQPVSAGFNIDVGNGHTTLLPSLFLLASMVRPLADPKITGMVGLLAHYQMLYLSLLYFYAFFNTAIDC
ncbi:conserved unknown protein [Ectocarpus siliculosus]|uniref:Uncharacterized protein n=1 Tax=Ectocarpus siliculosus TaxID=2880 RepID=D8LQR6_ECTSI|nr:conserved unknown protein [Ectocarpus siliculosus]|eukprot:CBN74943.1 conserved unknown protein [Ectocarpus siliculosus]